MWRYLLSFLLGLPAILPAQLHYVVVDDIQCEGNRRTKSATILREMDLAPGDTIGLLELAPRLEKNRTLVLNMTLFTVVVVNIGEWRGYNHIVVTFTVKEQWYLFPFPIFELADRNFNVWWSEQGRSLQRVNLGLRLTHYNVTGRRDKLKATVQFGYTQKYELDYRLPGFNRQQPLGFKTNLFYATNKETNYQTAGNKFLFFGNDQVQLSNVRLNFGLIYRPKLYVSHELDLEFHNNRSTDSIHLLNPDFFLNGADQQRFAAISYSLIVDRRDLRDYPRQGCYLKSIIRKDGLGFFTDRDALTFNTTFAQYFSFGRKWSTELILKGLFYLYRNQQPYFNSRSLGFRPDYLRGYELYVVDGMNFSYVKGSLRWQFFDRVLGLGKMVPISQLRTFPLQLYLTLNSDVGYVDDPFYQEGNPLSNTWLWGGGVGLDIVAYVDKVLQIEYSFSHLLENGVFLHYKFTF